MSMREAELFPHVLNFLEDSGYQILEENRGHKPGADIIAVKNGRKLFLELKGDSQAPDVDLGTALYQIMRFIGDGHDEYALALSEKYRRYAENCRHAVKKLGLRIYLVRNNGEIQELT